MLHLSYDTKDMVTSLLKNSQEFLPNFKIKEVSEKYILGSDNIVYENHVLVSANSLESITGGDWISWSTIQSMMFPMAVVVVLVYHFMCKSRPESIPQIR